MSERLTQTKSCLFNEQAADAAILRLKSEGLSFRLISKRLGKSVGSVTGRYYRLKGIRHASQLSKDAEIKRNRQLRRAEKIKRKSVAAFQAAIEIEKGIDFFTAVGRAKEAGVSFDMIGTCCGMSKQAVHKKWRRYASGG
jgi:hypothetical protein